MASRLLKKTSLDQAGLWVRPMRFGAVSAAEAPAASQQVASPSPPQVQPMQIARLQRLVHDLTTQLTHDKERLLGELAPHLVCLAIAIARRIVAAEIRQDRQVVERTVRAALEELSFATNLQIRVHPDDESIIQQILTVDETMVSKFSEMKVIADPTVERGGCVVESERGIIDASIPTQFAQLQETLLSYLEA